MTTRASATVLTVLLACIAAPASAAADGEPARLGLTPVGQPGAYFELTLAPGERHAAVVEASNFGADAADARTYAADVYSIVNGGFGVELAGETPNTTTGWVSYPAQELTLGARQALRVKFVVGVPVGTPPGEYLTALVIESTAPMPGSGPLMLSQVNRSAIAVAIDVPGPREPGLAIGGVAHFAVEGHSSLVFEVGNPGNVHLRRPTGKFTLLDGSGTAIAGRSVVMDAVYAGTATRLEVPLRDPLAPGRYCAELSLTDADTGAYDQTECLAFTVAAAESEQRPADADRGGLPATNALAVAMTSVLMVVGGMLVGLAALLAARRRRPAERAGPGMEPLP